LVYLIKKIFVDVDGLFYVCKMVEIHHQFLLNNLFFLKFFISKFWQFFCCLNFPLNFHYFFHFSPKTIFKLWKFKNKKNMLVGEGGLIQLFNAKIVTKLCYFYFYKENESKLYFYIHWHVNSDRFDVYLPSLIYDPQLQKSLKKLLPKFLYVISKDWRKTSAKLWTLIT
jgi:hypothetical protein